MNQAEPDTQEADEPTHLDSTAQQRGCAARPPIEEATSHWREASRYLPMASDAHIENATRMQDA